MPSSWTASLLIVGVAIESTMMVVVVSTVPPIQNQGTRATKDSPVRRSAQRSPIRQASQRTSIEKRTPNNKTTTDLSAAAIFKRTSNNIDDVESQENNVSGAKMRQVHRSSAPARFFAGSNAVLQLQVSIVVIALCAIVWLNNKRTILVDGKSPKMATTDTLMEYLFFKKKRTGTWVEYLFFKKLRSGTGKSGGLGCLTPAVVNIGPQTPSVAANGEEKNVIPNAGESAGLATEEGADYLYDLDHSGVNARTKSGAMCPKATKHGTVS